MLTFYTFPTHQCLGAKEQDCKFQHCMEVFYNWQSLRCEIYRKHMHNFDKDGSFLCPSAINKTFAFYTVTLLYALGRFSRNNDPINNF